MLKSMLYCTLCFAATLLFCVGAGSFVSWEFPPDVGSWSPFIRAVIITVSSYIGAVPVVVRV